MAAAHSEVSFEMKIKAAYAASGLPARGIFMTIRRLLDSVVAEGGEGDDMSVPPISDGLQIERK